jgi:hypothetical protein
LLMLSVLSLYGGLLLGLTRRKKTIRVIAGPYERDNLRLRENCTSSSTVL